VKCTCLDGLTGSRCENKIVQLSGEIEILEPYFEEDKLNTNDIVTQRDLANMTSNLAIQLVKILELELTKKLNSSRKNIEKVTITGFRVGSLIVDFTIRFKNTLNVELNVLQQEYLALLNGSILNSTVTLSIKDTNECATGQYCGTNSICTNTIGSFTCTCKSGYTGDGVVCVKKDTSDYSVLAIVLVVCLLVFIILLFFIILLIRRRMRSRAEVFSNYYFLESSAWHGDPKMRAKKVDDFDIKLQRIEEQGSIVYSYS